MTSNTIAILTDYGLKDPYVGMVKAVINRINPQAVVIDITHEVPKYRVDVGAFILKTSYKYFRKGTIFLAVVDPEVGTTRKGVVIRTKNYVFVGPNNGLLTPAALDDTVEGVYEIRMDSVRLWEVSETFHGRDIFAPVAALISIKTPIESLCNPLPLNELVVIDVPPRKPEFKDGQVITKVFYIDDFGNLILDQRLEDILEVLKAGLGDDLIIKSKGREYRARITRTFAEVCEGCIAIYRNSLGLAEVGVFKGNASKALGIYEGDVIRIGKAL
jgi:S-adenosylmethionine hydrolase